MTINSDESSAGSCPVCASVDLERLNTRVGPRAYCPRCFHGWRTDQPEYEYTNTAMCSLGTTQARLNAQIAFFAPFTPMGARILEIGCATGELAAAVRSQLPISQYEGIELSPAGDIARPHLNQLHTSPLPELLRTKSIKGEFDLIIMSHVLEHLVDPGAELSAMRDVLSPKGVIFLEVPNRGGARGLPIDDNRSHLHFFCATSLTRLVSNYGLEALATATNVRLDARYADSLQVAVRRFEVPKWSGTLLSDHPALANDNEVVVWGAGSLADELLANFFDPQKIAFFIDTNPDKAGTTCLGRPVRGPEALGSTRRTVLVNSIDFANAITSDIQRLYPGGGHHLVRVGDLLGAETVSFASPSDAETGAPS